MSRKQQYKYAISACLVGVRCRWNRQTKINKKALAIFRKENSILVCPEVAAGLPTPRPACEIVGGDGEDVLSGKGKVVSKLGRNYSRYFIKGAKATLGELQSLGIKKVIFKSGSPSCGVTQIYSGKFNGKKKKGMGVTTALLKQNNILVKES